MPVDISQSSHLRKKLGEMGEAFCRGKPGSVGLFCFFGGHLQHRGCGQDTDGSNRGEEVVLRHVIEAEPVACEVVCQIDGDIAMLDVSGLLVAVRTHQSEFEDGLGTDIVDVAEDIENDVVG